MTEILAAAIGAIGVVLVAIIGAVGASKLGVGTNQEKLVATLKELIAAQDQKIQDLEAEIKELSEGKKSDQARIENLEKLTINQAVTIDRLQKQLAGA